MFVGVYLMGTEGDLGPKTRLCTKLYLNLYKNCFHTARPLGYLITNVAMNR